MMRSLNVGLDVDGVLADFEGMACHVAHLVFALPKTPIGVRDAMSAVGGEAALWKAIEERHGHQSIRPLAGARTLVDALRIQGHELWAVTSPPRSVPTWSSERVEWLWSFFRIPRERVVFCADKSLWGGDVLVDDYKKNLIAWKEGAGKDKDPRAAVHFDPAVGGIDAVINGIYDIAVGAPQ